MENQMITISAFKDRDEALISKALLEAAGVPVTLKDELDELQLQVRDTDAQLAQEVLVAAESPGWRRRTSRRNVRHHHRNRRMNLRVARCFCRGGGACVAGLLVFLLLLLPLGIRIHVSPFPLVFVFVFGGCFWVVRSFFRVRQRSFGRRRSV